MIAQAGLVAVPVAAAVLARLRGELVVPLLLVLVPLRIPLVPGAELSTLVLLGAVVGRAPAVLGGVRSLGPAILAWAALPAWMLLSAAWAHQAWFAVAEAGKWTAVALAALLAFADEAATPRRIAIAAFVAMAPMALWGLAERAHLVAPIGEAEELRARLIDVEGDVRGRALFWHPNRLAEFVEQLGLLLAACAAAGTLPTLAAVGVAIAVAGTWATGSTAGFATMLGGSVLVVAALLSWPPQATGAATPAAGAVRRAWRWGAPLVALGIALAVARGAFEAHGGIGSRSQVYAYALQVIAAHPWLGIGGGNWPLAVSGAPLGLSRFWFRSHTHSLLLQLWVEAGVVGVAAAIAFFAMPLRRAFGTLRSCAPEWRGVVAGAAAGVVGLLAHDLVHFFLRQPADGLVTGILLGVAAASPAHRATARPVAPAAPAPSAA